LNISRPAILIPVHDARAGRDCQRLALGRFFFFWDFAGAVFEEFVF